MKVIRTRIGVLVASCGLLAGAFGLTVIIIGPEVTGTLGVASVAAVASTTPCPNATVIEAGQCRF
jgi:hypothetical protein